MQGMMFRECRMSPFSKRGAENNTVSQFRPLEIVCGHVKFRALVSCRISRRCWWLTWDGQCLWLHLGRRCGNTRCWWH